jgi:hypothetical protein
VDGVVVKRVVAMVKDAAARAEAVTAAFGTAKDANLLNDSRLPKVFDPVLRVLDFRKKGGDERAGSLVQWNCHPEALGSENQLLTADFVASTVSALKEKHGCPVVYFTGTVGGLLAPPSGRLKNAAGELMGNGEFEFAEVYGKAVAGLAENALAQTEPIELTPISVKTTDLVLPTANMFYRIARAAGVLSRDAWVWQDDPWTKGPALTKETASEIMAIDTEVGCMRLGELSIACIPGEIYPELVYGEFQEPADAGADYPDAELELSVANLMRTEKWMLFGLANDEIGYLIPKRQWDARKPYAYGRDKSQYGEMNSCGPESARLVMEALAKCCR